MDSLPTQPPRKPSGLRGDQNSCMFKSHSWPPASLNSIKCPSHITFVIPGWLNAQMWSWRYRTPAVYFDENSLTGRVTQFKLMLFKDRSYSLLDSSLFTDAVVQSLSRVWDPMNWSTPGFPFFHYLLEFAQTHALWVNDVIQPSHPLSKQWPFWNLGDVIKLVTQ